MIELDNPGLIGFDPAEHEDGNALHGFAPPFHFDDHVPGSHIVIHFMIDQVLDGIDTDIQILCHSDEGAP